MEIFRLDQYDYKCIHNGRGVLMINPNKNFREFQTISLLYGLNLKKTLSSDESITIRGELNGL